MKAPFPYFGGKSRVADVIWERFGNTPNYIEPFGGSLAVLLGRPHTPANETANDADHLVSNFWRATKYDPRGVAEYADWPNNETDVRARHNWLSQQSEFREKMTTDPDYFDVKIAGWWCWQVSLRIGSGGIIVPDNPGTKSKTKNNPNGIHGLEFRKDLYGNFQALADRLRYVRVLCGDWTRCLTPVETTGVGLTAVLLDPPYAGSEYVYGEQSVGVSASVREWALAHGDDPLMRIALCGYREHDMPSSWVAYDWKASGGYGNQADGEGRKNAELERIWFSPHCLEPGMGQQSFFSLGEAA